MNRNSFLQSTTKIIKYIFLNNRIHNYELAINLIDKNRFFSGDILKYESLLIVKDWKVLEQAVSYSWMKLV